jgi:uracil-DNA glycosylase
MHIKFIVALSCAALISSCVDATQPDDTAEDVLDGKEDSAASVCEGLAAEAKTLCKLVPNNGWRVALKAEFRKPYFLSLAKKVKAARDADAASTAEADNVYPPQAQTFAALAAVAPSKVKIVILGQDPYVLPGQANGLGFSVSPGVDVPPSLNNIFAELVREANDPADADALPKGFDCPANGDLSLWAKRGVLFVDSVLTVQNRAPGSHKDFGWQTFTDAILRVAREGSKKHATSFLLWGGFAKSKAGLIDDGTGTNVQILTSTHPSPLASGFVGNHHFAKANRFLVDNGLTAIDFHLPGTPSATAKHRCVEVVH